MEDKNNKVIQPKKIENLLVTLKLMESSVKTLMAPILSLDTVSSITVVRNTVGPNLEKIKYVCPPRTISKVPLLNIISRLFLIIYQGKKNKPPFIIGYYLMPHGVLTFIAACILRVPSCICIIGDIYKHSKIPFFGKPLMYILKKSDIVTVTGAKSRNFLISKGVSEEKIYILPNTIDVERFKPLASDKKYDILSLGRLSKEKRLDILLHIISRLKENGHDLKVAIVGDGDERERLVSLSKELSLEKYVEFIGFSKEVEKYYESSKIFLLTSEREGLPLTIVEAMSCGVPVVSSNVGDIEDIISDGKNSFLVESFDDIDSYIEKISMLIKDRELYSKISAEASKVRIIYSFSNATKVWEEILSKIS